MDYDTEQPMILEEKKILEEEERRIQAAPDCRCGVETEVGGQSGQARNRIVGGSIINTVRRTLKN